MDYVGILIQIRLNFNLGGVEKISFCATLKVSIQNAEQST